MTQKNDTVDFFIRKARLGDAKAQYHLGSIYYHGLYDEPQNFKLAEEWYRKSAEQGNADAQYMLGTIYNFGMYDLDDDDILEEWVDTSQAIIWYCKSAEQGNTDALRELKELAEWHDEAQCALGKMYYYGHCVHCDAKQAVELFQEAVVSGNIEAMFLLSEMYYHGRGVPEDEVQAAEWCQKAAGRGNTDAQRLLGIMYFHGHGVPVNKGQTRLWFSKAADGYYDKVSQGDADAVKKLRQLAEWSWAHAQYKLGRLYESGIGVRKNWRDAAAWYRKAAKRGHKEAQAALQRLNR